MKRKPKLRQSDRYWYDVFLALSPSRPTGEAFGAIPETQYLAWFENNGVYGLEARGRHQRMVSALDRVFVDYTDKKRKAKLDEMKSSGGKSGGSRKLV